MVYCSILFILANWPIAKSYLRDITDSTNRNKGFSFLSMCWGLGAIGLIEFGC